MWHRVEVVLTDVSEERIASIFRVEGKKIRKSAREASVRDVKSRIHQANPMRFHGCSGKQLHSRVCSTDLRNL
jgi:hypothetical protein